MVLLTIKDIIKESVSKTVKANYRKMPEINLLECFERGVLPQIGYKYVFKINNEKYITDRHVMSGSEILSLFGQSPKLYFLIQKTRKGKEFIEPDDLVDFTKVGIERFIAQPKECKVLDLEDCFNKGRIPVITYQYVIKINTKKFTVSEEQMTGREILELIGGTPEAYFLRQRTKDGKNLVEADEVVDFTKCGIERFIAQKRNCNEGFVLDESVKLPSEDEDFLKQLGLPSKIVQEGNTRWLIIYDYLIPAGYNRQKADVAIMLHPQYPQAQIDMIYIHPSLQRLDGKMINALMNQSIGGRVFQRWSRHRTPENPWVPGEDNVSTHLDLMMDCLQAEFKKR